MTHPRPPASTRLVEIDHWLDRWLSELSHVAQMAATLFILTVAAALVIVTAVLFVGAGW